MHSRRDDPLPLVRMSCLVRGAWGATLLLAPARLLRAVDVDPSWWTVAVARILGARHVAQGAVVAGEPTPGVLRVGAVVDGLHASSGVLFAATVGARRAWLPDAALASTFGAVSWWLASRLDEN